MSDGELLNLIRSYEQASLGSQVAAGATVSTTIFPSNQALTTLELDRYNALNGFLARPLGDEIANRSQMVLPVMRDTLQWMLTQIMRMFVASKSVCRFDPENPNDEEQAAMETAVVNAVFMQQNNGFFVLHDFFWDALLMRNGYVEVYTTEEKEVSEERYTGLTQIELAELLQEKEGEKLEVAEQREYPCQVVNPMTGQPQTYPCFDIKLKRTGIVKKTCVTCLPPEEMRVSARARGSMEDVGFAMHHTTRTRSDMIADGYDPEWVKSLAPGRPNWLEIDALARNVVVDQLSIENPSDFAMQEIEVRKVVMRVDYDGDGIAELRRILVGGDKIGENEVIEETPYVSCEPMRMPHRHTGISIYDLVMDLQILTTQLWRQGIDNLKISNNQRVAVDWRNCNLDDLMSSRPGGVVRGNGPPQTWISPLEQPSNLISEVIPALEYVDKLRTQRTGIGKGTMGLDADELQNVTKGGQLAAMSAATLILELIARLLAEGVKGIFLKLHSELMRHQDKPLELEISGKWVQCDPSSWRRRTKVSVNVGLGSGNREELRANVQMLAQAQAALAQVGLVGPPQAYEGFKIMCDALGFQNPERFAMDPKGPEYAAHMQQMAANPPPQAPQVTVAQIKAQSEQAKQQSEDQRTILKLQAELAQAQMEREKDQLQFQQDLNHQALQGHKDREVAVDQTHASMMSDLIKAYTTIVSSQVKQDPQADASAMFTADIKNSFSQLTDMLQGITQHIQRSSGPRTATLPDGRQIKVSGDDGTGRLATLSDGRQIRIASDAGTDNQRAS